MSDLIPAPHVEIINGSIRTTSLKVAEHFGKRHDTVLRAIRNLDCSEDFRLRNFAECQRINELANGKPEPYFEMTRDGFTFTAMGFTGKEAAQWKEMYINAFNRMEAELHHQATRSTPYGLKDLRSRKALPGGLTLEQQDAIKALVKGRAEQLPEAARAGATITLWSAIKSKFGVSYKAIPPAQFGEALSLVARVPLKAEPDTLASMILFHGGQQPLQGQRFLVSFAEAGQGYTAQPIAPDCCVMTPAQFAQRLATPGGLYLDNATLLELIVASAQRLQSRAPAPH